jgi:hypothetical protein
MTGTKFCSALALTVVVLMILASGVTIGTAKGAPTTITAYKSTITVNVKSPYQSSQWADAQTISEPQSGITFAAKQNGTGWLFLMIWHTSAFICTDAACFGGIELGYLNNTQAMGSSNTPTMMILASTSFKNNIDEFVSTDTVTPTTVESLGYKVQSVCGLTLTGTVSNGQYTVECYKPFALSGASPYDLKLVVGSTIEIGFGVGEFSSPGDHMVTDMSTYTLTFSGQTYGSSSSTSSTTSTSRSSSTSSTSSTTSSSTTTSTSSTTTSTSKTTTSSTSSTTSSSTTTSTSSTTTSTSVTTPPAYTVNAATNSKSYVGNVTGTISGTVTGTPSAAGSTLSLQIANPVNVTVFTQTVTISANGAFSGTFSPGPSWAIPGTYTLTATYFTIISGTPSFFTNIYRFSYIPNTVTTTTTTTSTGPFSTSTTTTTATTTTTTTTTKTTTVTGPTTTVSGPTSTVTGPTTTVSGPTSTVTGPTTTLTSTATTTAAPVTFTNTSTSTVTQTTSAIPGWAYAAMVVLLLIGLAIGYVVKRPSVKQS